MCTPLRRNFLDVWNVVVDRFGVDGKYSSMMSTAGHSYRVNGHMTFGVSSPTGLLDISTSNPKQATLLHTCRSIPDPCTTRRKPSALRPGAKSLAVERRQACAPATAKNAPMYGCQKKQKKREQAKRRGSRGEETRREPGEGLAQSKDRGTWHT